MGLACAFFGVLSRFYFRREQTPRFHRFLASGPVRDARTEHPCVQTSARHEYRFCREQYVHSLPGRGVATEAVELFQVSQFHIVVGLISEQDQYAPANHRCNQTVGFLCFCRKEHVEKTRAPSERAGTCTVLSDGALLKCMFMHSCFSTSSGYADEASAASNKKKTPPQHAVTAAGQRGLC